jgi:hypothetical protein
MSFRKASSSDRSPSLLIFVNTVKASESSGSFDRVLPPRVRTTPGFAGPAGTFAEEDASSGVGRSQAGRDDPVRILFAEGGPSTGRDLLDWGIFASWKRRVNMRKESASTWK